MNDGEANFIVLSLRDAEVRQDGSQKASQLAQGQGQMTVRCFGGTLSQLRSDRRIDAHSRLKRVGGHQSEQDRDASRTSGFVSHSHHERQCQSPEQLAKKRQIFKLRSPKNSVSQRLKPSSLQRNHVGAAMLTARKGNNELVICHSHVEGLRKPHSASPATFWTLLERNQKTRNLSSLACWSGRPL